MVRNSVPDRNRSSGWKHAKISGHKNEKLICKQIETDKTLQKKIAKMAGLKKVGFTGCDFGGLHEKEIPSALGGKTKKKADLVVNFGQKSVGISVKKSLSGQVYLITAENFIRGMEAQYRIKIPEDIKRAIRLFWGAADDTKEIIKKNSKNPEIQAYELRKNRVTASTLEAYDKKLHDNLLKWFKKNICNITDFCFSRGLALAPEDSATIIWYKNMLKENSVDAMYDIEDLCNKVAENTGCVSYGTRNGGTTIKLPFGFVQWHKNSMQFHHKYADISKLLEKRQVDDSANSRA